MKIIRDLNVAGNLNTDLSSLLYQIKDEPNIYFNKNYYLRHPFSIYKLGEQRFYKSYTDLMLFLESQKDFSKLGDLEVFNKTKDVIESYASFIDDLYSIFKCFCPPNASKYAGKYNDRWLKATDSSSLIKKFINDIYFTEIFCTVNNEIKHNNGRISKINFKSGFNGNCFGFFIQKYDNEAIIPFEEIHPKYNGMHTAFSYNWFLLEILGQYYLLNNIASKTLIQLIFEMSGKNIIPQKVIMDNNEITNIIKKLYETITNIIFEDEYNKPFYQIELNDSKLLVKSPADKTFLKRFQKYKNVKIELSFSTDETTLSYGLPYFQQIK